MIETIHALPDSVKLPHHIKIDDDLSLREIVPKDSFGVALGMRSVRQYITWVALAAQTPDKSPVGVLKKYSGGSLRGRYAIQYQDDLAGYFGCAKGSEEGILSLSYFTVVRGKHLAERAVQAVTSLRIPSIAGFELTIADENDASKHVAAACGFTATDASIWDSTLGLHERIYRRPIDIQ